jgi:hypothetical protein
MTDVQMAPEAPSAPLPDVALPDTPNEAPARGEASTPDLESLARDMGWRPKEDWKGDDSGWRDAGEFVKHTVDANRTLKRELGEVKDVVKGLSKTNERILERELAKQRKALERQFAEAVDANDPTAARQVSAQIDALDRTPVTTDYKSKFKADNPWFGVDTEASAYATAMAGVAASEGKDPEAQLAYASEKVRKRFPELFDKPAERRTPPSVEGGSRSSPPAKKTYPPAVLQAAKAAVDRGRADSVAEYCSMYDKEMGRD